MQEMNYLIVPARLESLLGNNAWIEYPKVANVCGLAGVFLSPRVGERDFPPNH